MNLTLADWIFLIVCFVLVTGITVPIIFFGSNNYSDDHWKKKALKRSAIAVGIIIAALMGIAFFMNWYNTNTASGIRNYKDHQSEMSNGIEREITITAEDGREIYHYKGKVDVESDHEDNYIKFEREDGGREIIYYGITDTVLITEIK